MAFGIKINIGVDTASTKAKLANEIQSAVNKAVSGKPITIKHFTAELNSADRSKIVSSLQNSLNKAELKVRIKEIDASPAIKKVQKELQDMFDSMSASGLIANGGGQSGGTDGAKKQMRELKQVTAETAAAMQELKNIQSQLNSTYKASGKLSNADAAEKIVSTYRELQVEIERTRRLEGVEKEEAVRNLAAKATALQQNLQAQQQLDRAAKSAVSTAAQEASQAGRVISLRQQIQSWIENNTAAYARNKEAVDALLTSIQNENGVDKTALAGASSEFKRIQEEAHLAGAEGKSFFQVLSEGASKLSNFISVASIFHQLISLFKDMVANVRELDSAMTELRKVTDLTETQYRSFMNTAASMSKEIGATMSDMINSTADFARLGYGIEDATALAKAALVYKNVGDGINDVQTATESLISTMKSFGDSLDDPMRIVDMFNEVGNSFAISSSGIGEALTRSAAALSAAGNTIEESIGLITAMNAVVQNPEQVGGHLRPAA